MNTISIVALVVLTILVPYALYIDAMRRGRDSKGKFVAVRKNRTTERPLFYSELKGGVIV